MEGKNRNWLHLGLRGKLIRGIITLGLILCVVSCVIGYKQFTTVLERQYNTTAYYIADTALTYIDGDRFDEYVKTGVKDEAFLACEAKLDSLVVTTDATLIYAAKVDPKDYLTLTYVFDSIHPSSGFDRYPLNYTATDIDPQHMESVKNLMTTGERSEQYYYSDTVSSGAHTTAAVAIHNSKGEIVGMLAVEKAMTELGGARISYVNGVVEGTLLAVILCILLYSTFLNRQTIQPLLTITREAKAFTENNGQVSELLGQIESRDEIGVLARTIHKMQRDTRNYIINLRDITAEKERIGAELDVATHIQASMLPSLFPAFPDRPELDIYATMIPAKEVGGDFYDFFLVDDDRLAMVMADVSGKGVPAALFMVIAKTLIKNIAQTGISPKAILEKVNNQLCVGNDAEMFVTVWLGILEISTGKMTCTNAGHEYPVYKSAGGVYEMLKAKHGFVVAGMEGTRYTEYELQLEHGDRIFLYTDGVLEATNGKNELYGAERMLSILNRDLKADCKEILSIIYDDINLFVGDMPQFDDITMMCLQLMPPKNKGMKKLKLNPTIAAIDEVTAFVEQELEEAGLPMKEIAKMNIAVDEIFSNIAHYAEAYEVTVGIKIEEGRVTLRFADNGHPYDPTQKQDPDITLSCEERQIGGLGVFMVKQFMDQVEYEYHNGLNILTLTKKVEEIQRS